MLRFFLLHYSPFAIHVSLLHICISFMLMYKWAGEDVDWVVTSSEENLNVGVWGRVDRVIEEVREWGSEGVSEWVSEWVSKWLITHYHTRIFEKTSKRMPILRPLQRVWILKICEYLQKEPGGIVCQFDICRKVPLLGECEYIKWVWKSMSIWPDLHATSWYENDLDSPVIHFCRVDKCSLFTQKWSEVKWSNWVKNTFT
jgi:hypothetical protein